MRAHEAHQNKDLPISCTQVTRIDSLYQSFKHGAIREKLLTEISKLTIPCDINPKTLGTLTSEIEATTRDDCQPNTRPWSPPPEEAIIFQAISATKTNTYLQKSQALQQQMVTHQKSNIKNWQSSNNPKPCISLVKCDSQPAIAPLRGSDYSETIDFPSNDFRNNHLLAEGKKTGLFSHSI